MIYGNIVTESDIMNEDFEMTLIQESIDMSLYMVSHVIINESVFDRGKEVFEKIKQYLEKFFNFIIQKAQKMLEKIKTFFDTKEYKDRKDKNVKIRNVEMAELLPFFYTIHDFCTRPKFSECDDKLEKKSSKEYSSEYIKNNIKGDISLEDITVDSMIKVEYKDLEYRSFSDIFKDIRKTMENCRLFELLKGMNNIKQSAQNNVKNIYTKIQKINNENILNNNLIRLQSESATYGTILNIFVQSLQKYLNIVNKLNIIQGSSTFEDDDVSDKEFEKEREERRKANGGEL